MMKQFLPKIFVFLSFVLLSLLAACTSVEDAPNYDLSTDESVQRAYEQEIGAEVFNFCIERPSTLQDVILVGTFADDAGCLYDDMFVEGELGTIREMTAAGLAHNGWEEEDQREALALSWAEEVIFVENRVLEQSNPEFDTTGKSFSEPQATLNEDGSVTVGMWVEYSGGMLPIVTYRLHEIRILADGAIDSNASVDEYTIDYDNLLAPVDPFFDISTDEGVMLAYTEIVNAGVQIEGLCVGRPFSFNDVVLVGFFADDAGCLYQDMFVEYELGTIQEMTAAGLLHNGWEEEDQREALALTWAEEIVFVETAVLQQPNDDFTAAGQPFSPPAATLNDDGSVTMSMWVAYDGGMLPETTYKLHEVKILADGSLDSNRVAEQFTHDFGG